MNERVAQIGEQVRQAFQKVVEAWKKQEAARKKRILMIALGAIALAVLLVVVLSAVSNRYVVILGAMPQTEVVRARAALETLGIPAKSNDEGKLMVRANQENYAIGQLAVQGIPSTEFTYDVFSQASGLTTTEMEKREYLRMQWETTLANIIGTYDGVRKAHVMLNIDTQSTRVWDIMRTENTASVTLELEPNFTLSGEYVNAIGRTVGGGVNVAADQVTITDTKGNLYHAAGDDYSTVAVGDVDFLQRMGFEEQVERKMEATVRDVLSLIYADPDRYRVNATVALDWDKIVTEIKEYAPLEGTDRGVLDEEELSAIMSPNDFVGGVVGETDNTDVPIYVDTNGDGEMDYVEYVHYRDFAVSYTLRQIEKDGPKVASSSLSVVIDSASMTEDERQRLRESVAMATNLELDRVSVQNYVVEPGPGDETPPTFIESLIAVAKSFNLPEWSVYVAIMALVLLVLLLVLVLVLRARARKRRRLAELAAAEEERLEAERIQQEIEERKQQLKTAALNEDAENAITNEVREFARNNPEITANLLRNWLKEGE